MKSMKQIISILLTLAMTMSMITIPALAEEIAEIEKVIADNTVLTEPFDVTNEEEVDAGLYPYDQKTVLVKFAKKTNTLDVDGIASIEYLFKAKDGFWYTAHLADGTTPKMAIEALRSTSSVLVAEYNFLYETGATTLCDNEGVSDDVKNNGKSKDQWHLDSCGFQKAWKKLKNDKKNPGGDSGVIVAVIDTGVDYDHEDLKNNMWTNQGEVPGDGIDNDSNGYIDDYYGVNIVAKKGNGDDDHGHGTHVAGIIAAGNNNVGVVGLAYNTKIMAIKAGQASGYFLNTDVCKAIDYARENGADVINMSFGSTATTIAVQDALEEAYTHSVLVAAAGNDGAPNEERYPGDPDVKPCYPAAYSFVLGVMAVDDYGVESSFTNYDVYGFNSVEYELYAPGNAITSTIPNDKYATWNGTSMAAPIVSAMAAVIRSVYNDPDMYPTKFIYGQLASTSERYAECLDPDKHGKHNIPQIANLYDALYKLPHPEISVSDYTTFDTSDVDKNNNGDGTIDSGETIALGFELRNRWGMSEDTIVTIDAKSQADIPNPYVEFSTDGKKFSKSASVDYGSVGTYSTQDCGKIIEKDLWTGWENPFYVKISKDTPNDTILAINVNITCKNALDAEDKTIYSLKEPVTINLIVKNGVVLPQVIDEDMTLTKDNYYIIQNQTIIEYGATVTVTEGTNIQFWTNDSTDPYADKYMAGLVVRGKLNCVGTEEEPIEIFPSDLMRRYRVEIYESGSGKIYYNHTNLTNLCTAVRNTKYNGFTEANNCEFNQNVKGGLYCRYFENGEVKTSTSNYEHTYIIGGTLKNSAFYKLGGISANYGLKLNANCINCAFIDSFIEFDGASAYTDCVFYGNNNYLDSTKEGSTSNYTVNSDRGYSSTTISIENTARDEITGKVYLQVKSTDFELGKILAEYLGGNLVYIETAQELAFIKASGLIGRLGAYKEDSEFKWVNGDPVNISYSSGYSYLCVSDGAVKTLKSYSSILIELPGELYIEDISFVNDRITLDSTTNYQLKPIIYPSMASEQGVVFFSSNTAVVTVAENGFVTPVGKGTATVYAFSEDMQVSASVEITVKDEVKATSINVPETMQVNIGETASLNAVIKPANTTKMATYKSSNETTATVDAEGNITAISEGKVIITTSVLNGDEVITAETIVNAVVPVKTIEFDRKMIYLKPGEKEIAQQPIITPNNATNQNVIWDSSNSDICYVNEDGEIVGVAEGLATLKATVENTDLSAYFSVCVSDEYDSAPEIKQIRGICDSSYRELFYIVTDDGQLWKYGYEGNSQNRFDYIYPTKVDLYSDEGKIEVADIAHFSANGSQAGSQYYVIVLDKNGNLYRTNIGSYAPLTEDKRFDKISEGVEKILTYNFYEATACVAVLENGSVLVVGKNTDGRLGVGGKDQFISEPVIVALDDGEKVIDGYVAKSVVTLVTEKGNLYNSRSTGYFEKVLEVEDPIINIRNGIAFTQTHYVNLSYSTPTLTPMEYELIDVDMHFEDGNLIYIPKTSTSTPVVVTGFEGKNIKNIISVTAYPSWSSYYGKYFYILENGDLYTTPYYISKTTKPVHVPMLPSAIDTTPILKENDSNLENVAYDQSGNVTSAVLKEEELKIGFNVKIDIGNNYDDIVLKNNNNQLGIRKSLDLNNLVVNLGGGFTDGSTYTLTIPEDSFVSESGKTNKSITITFIYQPDEDVEENPDLSDTPETEGDESGHTHSFTTETVMPTVNSEGKITNICECGVAAETVLPEMVLREDVPVDEYQKRIKALFDFGYNTYFTGNVILNRLNEENVAKWLRITAPTGTIKYGFGGNYWGTTNPELINHQIVDYNDFVTLGDIIEGEFLTKAPENTFPFVTEAYLTDESGEVQSIISGGKVKFVVKFNRDMDMDYGAKVFFGSSYPYADYEIEGSFADARTWVGETELKTVIENGYQFIRVTNGRTVADENGAHLKLYDDWARFGFEIDTTSAMAMMMQGYADNDGIHLEWMQDDYDTLAGYNVYRADTEDGNYVRINKTIIPSDENTFTDTEVEPGKKYYYTFTVVLTDATDSKPAGKISVTAKDTMAPDVYHSPVYTATTGNKVIISATVSDNIGIENAKLYYRVKGTEEWKTAEMSKSNSKYTASIPAAFVTTEGVEYYIAAFDGVNYTYAGSHTSENPYEITVYQAVENNAKGDVDGDGNITVLDALKLLRAIYDESLLTQEEFLRADINGDGSLSAVEALRILQYANKTISSVLW